MKLSEYFRRIFDDHYAGIRDTHAVGSFSDLDADQSRSFCRGGVSFQMAGSKIDIGYSYYANKDVTLMDQKAYTSATGKAQYYEKLIEIKSFAAKLVVGWSVVLAALTLS